jgi:hypothetical protein
MLQQHQTITLAKKNQYILKFFANIDNHFCRAKTSSKQQQKKRNSAENKCEMSRKKNYKRRRKGRKKRQSIIPK